MHRQIADDPFDPGRRFVKVTGINDRGFVEFEFSVGQPELCVELMLPLAAFEEFCLAQNVSRLGESSETMTGRSTQ
ncbi:phenol hydroxylase subunit [Paraburkholderia dinghuensis]|uniref:Phenol hydroxylase n=1 Tax=Paraburkholderia dinghuensis TaxID=2305225 RepID=A0A3N6PXA8_9BURK|nr:phenol hydroxylase subunit [Paraburkholderia dinghuensis]RQH06980.1 phenol hydroxylase [Paraburkholderia dinghuensis]